MDERRITAPPAARARRLERGRAVARWLLAAAYAYAGYVHLSRPGFFLPIVPGWVPAPYETVLLTGACEVAGAAGLLVPATRRAAGIALAAYAVCVFPANIKHALYHVTVGNGTLGWWYHGPRLLAQPAIVWWALFAGRVVDWPFGRRDRRPSDHDVGTSPKRRG